MAAFATHNSVFFIPPGTTTVEWPRAAEPDTSTHAWHLKWEFESPNHLIFNLEPDALSTRPHAPKHIIILQIIRIVYASMLCNEISVTVNYLAHLAGVPIVVSDISGTDHSVHDPSPGESSLAAGVGDDGNIGGTELIGNRA